jgi:conjugative transfer signal peptidase TraF
MSLARQPRKPPLFSFRLFAPPKVSEGRSLWRMVAGSTLALVGLLALPMLLFGPPPLSINVSGSLPVGLYWTGSLPEPGNAPGETISGGRGRNLGFEVGMIVSACLPPQAATSALERGYLPEGTCPSGAAPVGKFIAALPGDTVDVTDSGSFVNGALLPNSAPLLRDSKGRAMPRLRGRIVLAEGTAWLYSGHSPRSFDSRYYGPVPLSGVRGQLFPLLTRGEAYRPPLRPPQE